MTRTRAPEVVLNLVLRISLSCVEKMRRAFRLISRPELFGSHAIPFTLDGKLVLVKLRYVAGWRLPGGGLNPGETPSAAALRELGEEIGLCTYSGMELIRERPEQNAYRRGRESVYLVTGVTYQPRWCLEVEAVEEFDLAALPTDLSPWTRDALDVVLSRLETDCAYVAAACVAQHSGEARLNRTRIVEAKRFANSGTYSGAGSR